MTALDSKSILITSLTAILGYITHLTSSNVGAFFTVGAGATAMVYNVIRIVEFVKRRRKNRIY